ncbi:hypothetical protein KY346_00270 [Candidatus Woesearchaeota archaeon]|nr:hypothetical protein [Candidatus Woesearchaeota archaeon]
MADWEDIILTREDKETGLFREVKLVWNQKKNGVHNWFKDIKHPRTFDSKDLEYVCHGPVYHERHFDGYDKEIITPHKPIFQEEAMMNFLCRTLKWKIEEIEDDIGVLLLSDVISEGHDVSDHGWEIYFFYMASYVGWRLNNT